MAGLSAAGLVLYLYWWRIQRPIPNLDGEHILSGLDATVNVLRDRNAIPHIYAETDDDLFRAQGYIHAQERLWQMEQKRRIAHGTLAEVFGAEALDADRFSRTVGFRRAAEAELSELGAEVRRTLEAYAQGVNEYIRQNEGKLSAEFNLLRLHPREWTPLDTVALMKVLAWDFSVNWESELERLLRVTTLGTERASELEHRHASSEVTITDSPTPLQAQAALVDRAAEVLQAYERIKPWIGAHNTASGSNSWVIAPKASASRRALLANDTHMGVQIPVQWYEMHLASPSYEVAGASLPGTPGIWIGHNRTVAWGIANALCDVQDLYLEREDPERPGRFELDGEWYEGSAVDEEIHVRGQDRVHIETVRSSRHGPLIHHVASDSRLDLPSGIGFSLRWTGHDPGQTLQALLAVNRAQKWESFVSALKDWSAPPTSFTYADVDGNIGYTLAGRIPARKKGRGLVPSPGWDSQAAWKEYVPFSDLPRVFNPDSGRIVAANNQVHSDGSGPYLGDDFDPGWRAEQLTDLLIEKDRYSLRDMAEMQMDTGCGFARRLAPWFGRLEPTDPYEKLAGELLRKWDFRMGADSSAATVFQYCWRSLLQMTFGGKLGSGQDIFSGASLAPLFPDRASPLDSALALADLIERHAESAWYADAETGRPRDRVEILGEALRVAVLRLRRDLGDNTRRWEWGRLHQVRFSHVLGSARLLRTYFNRGPFPVGGDATTPMQTADAPLVPPGLVQSIPNYRQILDTGDWGRSRAVVATGQSGHPLSQHYADQVDMWREGSYHAMPWERKDVEEAAVYRMKLHPEKSSDGVSRHPSYRDQ